MHAFRIYGSAEKPAEPILLAAGPLRLLFDNGEIRYLRLGEVEVLRRVYAAVRDRTWATIPPVISGVQIRRDDESFDISYHVQHSAGEMQFSWDGHITGKATGQITFAMSGRADADFLTNRTGFCVLHANDLAGKPCTIEHTDGSQTQGIFPDHVSPHQPFKNIRAIRHSAGGCEIRVQMEGDIFEMEDQRNWSDGSFKTYCRPHEMPMPYELKQGQEIKQTITIELLGRPEPMVENHDAAITLDLTAASRNEWVAQVGLALGDDFHLLDEKSIADIKSMHPRHLRLDLDLSSPAWRNKLVSSAPHLKAIGAPLEVALTCPEHPQHALRQLAEIWPELGLKAAIWLILASKGVTGQAQAEPAREALSEIDPQALFGGGTSADFVAVNRQHPAMEHLDLLTFSLNPQIHSVDSYSLIENLQSQADIVESAIVISADRPVSVSPVTLKRRSAGVDARQMSLLAAGWTIGSLAQLCNADYLTYFETHGLRGVMQGNTPSPIPHLFPSAPGDLFPVYHVLKSFLSFHPEHWSVPPISRPLEVAALHLIRPDRHRLLIANLTPAPRKIELTLTNEATLTLLDAASVDAAFRDHDFWVNANLSRLATISEFELGDYAVAAIDWSIV